MQSDQHLCCCSLQCISKLVSYTISLFLLDYIAEWTVLSLTWSEAPKAGFLATQPIYTELILLFLEKISYRNVQVFMHFCVHMDAKFFIVVLLYWNFTKELKVKTFPVIPSFYITVHL